MRLAVLADIHGNLEALDAVLADAAAQGVERLYINGDVVNRGPDSVACMQRVLALPPAWLGGLTLGNHDDLMLLWHDHSPALPPDWWNDLFWGATAWSTRQLAETGLLDPIRGWPMQLRVSLPGFPEVVIAHGSPDHYREAIGTFTPPQRVLELLDTAGAGVLVASHIHRPMLSELLSPAGPARWIINTGAVGAPFDGNPDARYLLLDGRQGAWVPSIRAVPYDRSGLLERFETSGLLDAGGLSARIFREEILSARSIYTPFWDWAEVRGVQKTEAQFEQFRAERPELFIPA
ncbi:metallophosphoesterase family protein [Deinococcus sp. KNUC1210]|uniref:metallophosphoesterase family protein n=1 Tax=Deinococcus sp. KNUC1210 TaxID=2917691 RepID=UPI001EEF8084|nr:metallophosphoesterase [Deinococcus sp. KNUC1210]ULH16193.1 metallophosphoesterase family protein [Deinococcus sp. KNUC1210]